MSTATSSHEALLRQLKEISGRRIEGERRRRFLTQRQFAARVRFSIRWLREIESGNPIVKLDDHLRCAATLGMAPSYIFFPLLYHAHGEHLLMDVAQADLVDVERRCIRLVTRRTKEHRIANPLGSSTGKATAERYSASTVVRSLQGRA